jgi:hypothetical protein
MTQTAQQSLEFTDFSKGMQTYSPPGGVTPGYYLDSQNMTLPNKAPKTVGGLTRFNTTPAPNGENIVWCEPYTTGSPAVTTMLVATDAGVLYKYTLATDLWETLLLGLSTSNFVWTHVPFRGALFFTNGSDPVLKYNGTNVLPVGSFLIADMETDETWTGTFTAITGIPAYLREGLRSLRIFSGNNAIMTYAATKDFTLGINGAPAFTGVDSIKLNIYKGALDSTGVIRIRFRDATNPTTKYFETASTTISTSGWQLQSFLISSFVNTGAASWTTIGSMQIFVDSGDSFIFDNVYQIYSLAPPVGGLIDLYNQQMAVAGVTADLVSLQYSDAGTPDYFPVANIARFSGGRNALEKTDQITALRSYFDELIVGKVNSGWTFSGTGTNVSISALPLTLGIDAHRGIVETPWALHYLFENNIFGSRLTSRGLISTEISSLLRTIDGNNLVNTVAIRNDRDHLIRWSFRTINATNSQNDLGLLYDYIANAWTSVYSPKIRYYTRGIVNGVRETLAVQYDGYIRRVDTGTDFDGTPIVSWVTLPYLQPQGAQQAQFTGSEKHGNVVRWINGTVYLKGTADVIVYARFADTPSEFDSATFVVLGTVTATPDGDKGYFDIGQTSRWVQFKFQANAGQFEIMPPIVIGYNDTQRRI